MNVSSPFIQRPVATTLLVVGVALAGAAAYTALPVSPLPQVDFPTIYVSATLPGASPETMAASVATPLERQFGRIAGVSGDDLLQHLGRRRCRPCCKFDLGRNIDAAARDVAARHQRSARLLARRACPIIRPASESESRRTRAHFQMALTSPLFSQGKCTTPLRRSSRRKALSPIKGTGQVFVFRRRAAGCAAWN